MCLVDYREMIIHDITYKQVAVNECRPCSDTTFEQCLKHITGSMVLIGRNTAHEFESLKAH